MAQTIKIKRSAVAGKVPTLSDLALGELALNSFDGKLYARKDNGTASVVELSGGGASVTTSDTAPNSPSDGDLWYDSVGGRTYVYYADGSSSQWVDASPQVGGGGSGPIAETAQVISADFTLTTGSNGLSAGPVEIAATYAVTVPANATWVIV